MNVTIGQEVELNVTTYDKDGDVVTLNLETELPAGAHFDAKTGVFTWTPATMDNVNIS